MKHYFLNHLGEKPPDQFRSSSQPITFQHTFLSLDTVLIGWSSKTLQSLKELFLNLTLQMYRERGGRSIREIAQNEQ